MYGKYGGIYEVGYWGIFIGGVFESIVYRFLHTPCIL